MYKNHDLPFEQGVAHIDQKSDINRDVSIYSHKGTVLITLEL